MTVTPYFDVSEDASTNFTFILFAAPSTALGDTGRLLNRYLVVAVCFPSSTTITSATVGDVALTQIGSTLTSGTMKLAVYEMDEATLRTRTSDLIFFVLGAAGHASLTYNLFYGVDQTTPRGTAATATGSGTTPSVTPATIADQMVVDFVAQEGDPGSATEGAGQTKGGDTFPDTRDNAIATSREVATGTSTVMSWTTDTSDDWASVAFGINFVGGKDTEMLVEVDWNDNGDFNDTNDDVSDDVLDANWFRGRGGVTEEFGMGTGVVVLNNKSGLYSPYDTAGTLYDDLLPGRKVRISVSYLSARYGQFTGYISQLGEGRSDLDSVPTTTLDLSDLFDRLNEGNVRILLQEDQRIDELLETIRAETQLTAAEVDFDTALTTLPIWWTHQSSPMEAFRRAAREEAASHLFVSVDGLLTWRNRNARSLAISIGTFALQRTLDTLTRIDDFVDEVRIRRSGILIETSVQVVYALFPIGRAIEPGSTHPANTMNGEYPLGSVRNPVTPVSGEDYTFNSAQDGTGNDVTSQVSVDSFTSFGGGWQIVWDNGTGKKAYIQRFEIRGEPVRNSTEENYITKTNSESPVRDRTFKRDFEFNDDADELGGFATFMLDALSRKLPRPAFRPTRRDTTEITAVLSAELGSKIVLQNLTGRLQTKIDDEFFIEEIGGRLVKGADNIIDVRWRLSHEAQTLGNFFRMSGSVVSHSVIKAASASADGDRIAF